MVRRDRVPVDPVGMPPLGQPRLIVAAAADPRPRGLPLRALAHGPLERGDRLHARRLAVDGGLGQVQARKMGVRVDEPGQQRAAPQLDHARRRALEGEDVGVAAGGEDASATDRESGDDVVGGVDGVDLAAREDQLCVSGRRVHGRDSSTRDSAWCLAAVPVWSIAVVFEDRFTVQAPVSEVWAFLRDPQQVAACIPGAERIDVIDDRHYHVVAGARVSLLSVSFGLNVTVTEIEEPLRLVSVAEGMDPRIKERVKLRSALTLEPRGPAATDVIYRIDLTVFGKLASLGLSVIKGKAKQMADEFAARIRARLEAAA